MDDEYCCHLRCFKAPSDIGAKCPECESPTYCHCECKTYRELKSKLRYCCSFECFVEPFWQKLGIPCNKCRGKNYCRCKCKLHMEKKACIPIYVGYMHTYEERLKTFGTKCRGKELAKNGFFSRWWGIFCHACDVQFPENARHDVERFHRKRSPDCPFVRGDPRLGYLYEAGEKRGYDEAELAITSLLERGRWNYTTEDILNQPIVRQYRYCCKERCVKAPERPKISLHTRWVPTLACEKCQSYDFCKCDCVTRGYCCRLHCFKLPDEQVDGMACLKCRSFSYCSCHCETYKFEMKRFQISNFEDTSDDSDSSDDCSSVTTESSESDQSNPEEEVTGELTKLAITD